MPTDHIQPKQKDFKLFDSITSCTLRERATATLIDPITDKFHSILHFLTRSQIN